MCRPIGDSGQCDHKSKEPKDSLREQIELEVRLISGQQIGKVTCCRSAGQSELRELVKEACGIRTPFWLLLADRLLTRADERCLDGLEVDHVVLVKRSLPELGQELVDSARHGDAEEVLRLLEDGAEIDSRDGYRLRTALMWAAAAGHQPLCQQLLQQGANPCLRASGTTAAQLAQGNGYEELAEMLEIAVARHECGGGHVIWRVRRSLQQLAQYRAQVLPLLGQLGLLLATWLIFFAVGQSVVFIWSVTLYLAHVLAYALVAQLRTWWPKRKSRSAIAPMPN